MHKLIRITTVPISLQALLKGQSSFMKNHYDVVVVSSPGESLQEVADREKVRAFPIEMTRTIAPLKDVTALWNMYRFLKREKPFIVHTHTPKAGIVGMLGAKLAGVPIRLHTVAGLPLMEARGIKREVLDFVEKLTYSSATKVYPNSKGLYDFILHHHFTSKHKLKVIANGSSNGIDTTYFSPENISQEQIDQLKVDLGILPDDFVFIFVGRLVGDKGINELVEAFSKFRTPNSKLLLVGPLESELDPLEEETLKEIDCNPQIISVGFQADVRPYFAVSDALVFPSYREGFPNVVMQAGAMGLPCIVTDINGCNEIIIEGENGLIIPVKNKEAIIEAMQKMKENQALFQKLNQNARSLIQSRYEQSVVWNALLEEYQDLISSK